MGKCGKLGFRTREQARRTGEVIAGISPSSAPPVRLYRCERCGLFHWTSLTRREYERTKR